MNLVIADGSTKDIVVGSIVTIKDDFTPTYFNGQTQFVVTKIEQYGSVWYPFVKFYAEQKYLDKEEVERTAMILDEESAVSPELITGVY